MQQRNNTVDIIRGFAMLLVVLGHTMSGSTSGFQDSLLFQIIWTLQMPLFIIISGYVTRYSRPITDGTGLLKFFKKRSLAYLLPWVVWTLVVRAGIFGQTKYYDAEFLIWHIDSGYWFLITIWTIAMVFGIADMLSNKIAKEKNTLNILLHFAFCGIGMIILGVIGYLLGLSFLGIKLTLYYLPMYLMGYLYGQLQEGLLAKKYGRTAINWSIAICLGIWLALINRIDFYGGADGGLFILLRFATSVMGCVAVIGLFTSADFNGGGIWLWAGVHSLEIYLTHYLFLNLFKMAELPAMTTLSGMALMTANYALTLLLTITAIKLLQKNATLNYLLYAKHTPNASSNG